MFLGMNLFFACSKEPTQETSSWEPTPTVSKIENGSGGTTESPARPPTSQADEENPSNHPPILPDNVRNITKISTVTAKNPPYYHVSGDGKRAAVGNHYGIRVFEIGSNELIMEIPMELPNCPYGMGRYFRLNADGTYLGIATDEFVQIWQIGGGKIFERTINRYENRSNDICGIDIPEISLSPDGSKLILSGFEKNGQSPKYYFWVIDVLKNEIIYEWDGEEQTAHGRLYDFPNLGFSDDGEIIQTFDPTRFIASEGKLHQAFRFWSSQDWSEIERSSPMIQESFSSGDVFFGVSGDQSISIKSRLDGRSVTKLDGVQCSLEYPCEVLFSADGSKAAILSQTGEMTYFGNHQFAKNIDVWHLKSRQRERQVDGLFRNLDAVYFNAESAVQVYSYTRDDSADSWWTFPYYFSGMVRDRTNRILFNPVQNNCENDKFCSYARTCVIDARSLDIECREGYLSFEGISLSIRAENQQVFLTSHHKGSEHIVGQLLSEFDFIPETHRVRLLGYSDAYQIGFYCLDASYRQQACEIVDFSNDSVMDEMKDVSYLRFSSDGRYAAFIDKSENRLNIVDLSAKKIIPQSAYQARAFSVNPVFLKGGEELVYIVQDLEVPSRFSIELVDLASKKVQSRTRLDLNDTIPTVFSIDLGNRLWAVGDAQGYIWIFDAASGDLIHKWHAHADGLTGLAFSAEGGIIISMGEKGSVTFWGLEE